MVRPPSTAVAMAVCAVVLAASAAAQGLPAAALDAWTPPPCQGLFSDVPCTSPQAPWIEQLYRDQITAGCRPGRYCPTVPVTRGEIAVLLERAMRGTDAWPGFVPPAGGDALPARTTLVSAVVDSTGAPDAGASGDGLLAAVASIPTTGPEAPAEQSPWLVLIGPGVFDLGSATLTVRPWTTVTGAGQRATVLRSALDGPVVAVAAGATGTVLQHVGIVHPGGVPHATALAVDGSWRLRLLDVGVEVGTAAAADSAAVDLRGAMDSHLERVSIRNPNGVGIRLNDCGREVVVRDSTIDAQPDDEAGTAMGVAIAASETRLTVTGSTLYADTDALDASSHCVVQFDNNEVRRGGVRLHDAVLNARNSSIGFIVAWEAGVGLTAVTLGDAFVESHTVLTANDSDFTGLRHSISAWTESHATATGCRMRTGTIADASAVLNCTATSYRETPYAAFRFMAEGCPGGGEY